MIWNPREVSNRNRPTGEGCIRRLPYELMPFAGSEIDKKNFANTGLAYNRASNDTNLSTRKGRVFLHKNIRIQLSIPWTFVLQLTRYVWLIYLAK